MARGKGPPGEGRDEGQPSRGSVRHRRQHQRPLPTTPPWVTLTQRIPKSQKVIPGGRGGGHARTPAQPTALLSAAGMEASASTPGLLPVPLDTGKASEAPGPATHTGPSAWENGQSEKPAQASAQTPLPSCVCTHTYTHFLAHQHPPWPHEKQQTQAHSEEPAQRHRGAAPRRAQRARARLPLPAGAGRRAPAQGSASRRSSHCHGQWLPSSDPPRFQAASGRSKAERAPGGG